MPKVWGERKDNMSAFEAMQELLGAIEEVEEGLGCLEGQFKVVRKLARARLGVMLLEDPRALNLEWTIVTVEPILVAKASVEKEAFEQKLAFGLPGQQPYVIWPADDYEGLGNDLHMRIAAYRKDVRLTIRGVNDVLWLFKRTPPRYVDTRKVQDKATHLGEESRTYAQLASALTATEADIEDV